MYKLTLSAQNDIGTSDDSQAITVTTLEEAPEGPPVEVRVQSTGSQSLKVSWLPPRRDLRHGTVLGYYIGYKVSSSDDQFQYKHFIPETPPSASSSSSPSSSFVNDTVQTSYLTNLKQLTRYQISVQAYNKGGVGPMSQYVEASTIVTTPPKSPTVTTLSSTNSSIAVLIDVEDKEKLITSEYVLHYKEDTKKEWKEIRLSPHIQEYHLMDLLCGTRYQLYMTASNTVGRSEPGPTVSVRTKGAAPVSPSMASAFVDISTSEVTINLGSWSDGGCPIHYFNIQNKQRNAKNWTPIHEKLVLQNSSHKGSSRHLTLTNFLPDREYIVQINARNDAGVTQAEYDIRIPSDILFPATPSHPYVMSASGHRGQSPMTRTKYDGDHNGDLRPPPLTFSSSQLTTRSPPSFNDNDYMTMNDLPLYKNLALILPIMASLAVITLLMATVFWCFRRSPLIESNYGFPEQGKPSNTVSLCELSSGNSTSRLNISSSVKASASSQANNTASESIMAANNQHHLRSDSVHSQLSSFDGQTNGQQATSCILLSPQKQTIHFKIHEYAEPYTMSAVDGRTCQMTKEQFATIKRANPRARPSIYAPGPAQQGNGSFIEQPQQQLFICQRH
ncbi:Down syndrome cell adhesion molecule -like protein [Halotydeus destructor]|nr:Down syndrome cell adhesion molecule -like protein [Halotydeus destructor]